MPVAEVELRLTVTGLVALTGLPEAFSRAMVIVPESVPAVSVCGDVVKPNCVTAAKTSISNSAAVSVVESLTMIDCSPTELRVALKLPTPLVRLEPLGGNTAAGSLLANCSGSEARSIVPDGFSRVTTKLNAWPAAIEEGSPLITNSGNSVLLTTKLAVLDVVPATPVTASVGVMRISTSALYTAPRSTLLAQ